MDSPNNQKGANMKINHLVLISSCCVPLMGCAYRGAVYSEYEQVALDVRSSAASSAPVQVNLGYDRGVFTYVPKQNGETNSTQGEAVSVVSWNNICTELNPMRQSTNSVLKVDAGFISGVAADVVSAPEGSSVTIVAPSLTNTVAVSGSPGERIAAATAAFAPATIAPVSSSLQARRVALIKQLAAFGTDGAKANQVLQAAGFPTVAPNKAISEVQDRIVAAQSEEAVKKLEDAFNQVK
jgi:hypothetical protein